MKRSGPLKRTRLRRRKKPMTALEKRKRNGRSPYWRIRADKLWGRLIHRGNHCAVHNGDCKGKMEAHHVISRRISILRHSINNGILLCSYHHKYSLRLSPHQGQVGFTAWMIENRPEQWTWAQEHKWDMGRPDYKAACMVLAGIAEAAGVAWRDVVTGEE